MSGISTQAMRPGSFELSLQAKDFLACPISGTVFSPVSRRLVAIASFLLITLASLSGAKATASVSRAAGDCGTVIFSPLEDITSFNPLFADTGANSEASEVMFANLFWINRFGQIDWSRSLASAIQVTNEAQIYDITLRPWNWSDGVPVTTADVLYDFALIKALGPAAVGAGDGGMPGIIKSMTAADSTHLRIVLTRKVNPTWFILNGLVELQPLPAHAWSHYTLDQLVQLQTTPSFFNVIDGPLRFRRLDPGSDAIYDLNPFYAGPKSHFSRFIFKFIETDGGSVQQIEAGDVDLTQLPFELWNAVRDVPGIRIETAAPSAGAYLINLNFQNKDVAFFKDVRVRQAMEDAIDQASMVNTVLHGFGAPVYTAIPTGFNSFLTPQFRDGKYPVEFNPAKARLLLKLAGFIPGSDGIMQKDGRKLKFTNLLATGSDNFTEMTEFIQANLRTVGIEMDLKAMDFNEINNLMTGDPSGWQAAITNYSPGDYPSGESQYVTGASSNSEGYADPEMDRRINESMNKPGLAGLYDYETYAAVQQPSIFTVSWAQAYLVSDRLHGIENFIDPAGQLSVDQLFCTDKR